MEARFLPIVLSLGPHMSFLKERMNKPREESKRPNKRYILSADRW